MTCGHLDAYEQLSIHIEHVHHLHLHCQKSLSGTVCTVDECSAYQHLVMVESFDCTH